MSRFVVGQKVRAVTMPVGFMNAPKIGETYTVSAVHEGNMHCPDDMIALEGMGSLYYAWRFEEVENAKR